MYYPNKTLCFLLNKLPLDIFYLTNKDVRISLKG